MLLAYHADDEIRSISLALGVPLALLVAAICLFVLLRWPEGDAGNPAAARALVASLALAPLVLVAGGLAAALVLPALVPVAVLVYSAVAVGRIPAGGRKAEAVGAFAVSGLLAAYVLARALACVAVDGCFH